jgi:hypothetical protein
LQHSLAVTVSNISAAETARSADLRTVNRSLGLEIRVLHFGAAAAAFAALASKL